LEHQERIVKDGPEDPRLAAWAKTESKLINKNTGRPAAVTGFGKPKVKAGGGSLRNPASGSGLKAERRQVVKAASVLAKVSDRSGLFG